MKMRIKSVFKMQDLMCLRVMTETPAEIYCKIQPYISAVFMFDQMLKENCAYCKLFLLCSEIQEDKLCDTK